MQIRKARSVSTLRRLAGWFLLGASAVASAGDAQVPAACSTSPDATREIVLAFYRTGLVGLQPRAAFERYVSTGFVEHKPDVDAGTREATAAYLERLIKSLPQARWEILRTIAEGDHVFLHARFTPAPGA